MQNRLRRNMSRVSWLFAGGAACVVFIACATGSDPDLTGIGELTPDSGGAYLPPTNGRDSGTIRPNQPTDASILPDGAVVADAAIDSAPPPPTGPGDCVGSTSTQLAGRSYAELCDTYFNNSMGLGKPCVPGGTACAGDGTYNYCCFSPPLFSLCTFDYFEPQCVPK
jgi:hypothetical protein